MHLFAYEAENTMGAVCGVSLWDVPGVVLVVLTELPNNHGPSLTNNVDRVARRVTEILELDPAQTIMMEHDAAEDTFDLIQLDGHANVLRDVTWSHMTPERWAELNRYCGGLPWGVGPPTVRVPENLVPGRFDGVPIDDFRDDIRASERALSGDDPSDDAGFEPSPPSPDRW
ncbi:MAG: hypothetical protein AAF663_08660 [Planctomycetota bacterium]